MESQVISRSPNEHNPQQRDPLGLTPLPAENRERFLRFTLAKKNTVLAPLTQILEVMQLPISTVLPVPDMASSVLGICSWQGKTLWLIDLNTLVGAESVSRPISGSLAGQSPHLSPPIVIVVQHEARSLGLVVEQVGDVDLIDPTTIKTQTGLCSLALEPFVLGHSPQMPEQTGGTVLNIPAIVESFRSPSP